MGVIAYAPPALFALVAAYLVVVNPSAEPPRDATTTTKATIEPRALDPVFASFVMRSSFAAILEDPAVGGTRDGGAADEGVVRGLMARIRDVYCDETRGKPPSCAAGEESGFPPREEVTQPNLFDVYSYAQFKVAAAKIADGGDRRKLTERVGTRLLDMISELVGGLAISGDPDDLEGMRTALEAVLGAFKRVGYVERSWVTWPEPEAARTSWESDRQFAFLYHMSDPVILPSAQRLFAEEGFAQVRAHRIVSPVVIA